MKRILALFLITFIFFSSVKLASAHILATDKNIGAVLHIDPDDDPIVGQQAGFFFEFKDKENKFQPQNCDCNFSIFEGGKQIFTQPLFQNNTNPNLSSASVFYTFTQKDIYSIKIEGQPINPGSFQPFTLTYDIRVSRDSGNQNKTQNLNWIANYLPQIGAFFLIIIFLLIIIVGIRKGGDKK